jgi:hypothetical protein
MATKEEITAFKTLRAGYKRAFSVTHNKLTRLLDNVDVPPSSSQVESLIESLTDSLAEIEASNDDFQCSLEDYDGQDKPAISLTGGKMPLEWFRTLELLYQTLTKRAGEFLLLQRSYQRNERSDMNRVRIDGLLAELQAAEAGIDIVAIPVVSDLLKLTPLEFDAVRLTLENASALVVSCEDVLETVRMQSNFVAMRDILHPTYTNMRLLITRIGPTVHARVMELEQRASDSSVVVAVATEVLNRSGGMLRGGVHCVPILQGTPGAPVGACSLPAGAPAVAFASTPNRAGGAPPGSFLYQEPAGEEPAGAHGGAFYRGYSRVKSLNLPSFSGKREDWAEFKSSWEDIAHREYGRDYKTLAGLLKKACKGTAADLVKPVYTVDEDSYQLLWSKLYEYFGHNSAMIKAIYKELANLKRVRAGDPLAMINFASSVEFVYAKLCQVSPSTPDTVTSYQVEAVVELLPDNYRIEWQRLYYSMTADVQNNPFRKLVLFLCEEKSVLLRSFDLEQLRSRQDKSKGVHGSKTDEHPPKGPKGPGGKDKSKGRGKSPSPAGKPPGKPPGRQPDRSQRAGNPRTYFCVFHPQEKHDTFMCSQWKLLSGKEKRSTASANKLCLLCCRRSHRGVCDIPQSLLEKIKCRKEKCQKEPHSSNLSCFYLNNSGGASGFPDGS